MRWLPIFFLSVFCATAQAQLNESSSLAEVEFSQLTERDPSPLGEKALSINP